MLLSVQWLWPRREPGFNKKEAGKQKNPLKMLNIILSANTHETEFYKLLGQQEASGLTGIPC